MLDLKARICKGYMWLRDNPDHKDYAKALKLYEDLVDKLPPNIRETDCWPATLEDAKNIFVSNQPPLIH